MRRYLIAILLTWFSVIPARAEITDWVLASPGDWEVVIYKGSDDVLNCVMHTFAINGTELAMIGSQKAAPSMGFIFGENTPFLEKNVDLLEFRVDNHKPVFAVAETEEGITVTKFTEWEEEVLIRFLTNLKNSHKLQLRMRGYLHSEFNTQETDKALKAFSDCLDAL